MPLKSRSVDVIICDMPFGMKHGNYRINRKLYPLLFQEMLRVLSDDGKVSEKAMISCLIFNCVIFNNYSC